MISVTIYLHRHQSHRSLDLHPIASHFFRFWLWLTTGMRTKEWAAIHRKHHARCETAEDPHSPQILGLRKVLWQGAELYRAACKDTDLVERYGKGTPDDWIERHVYWPHTGKGIFLMLLIDLVLFGVPGIAIWGLQMFWIPFFAAGVINGIAHYWGYRNFECPDAARNLVPWGILIVGEELHNNHHTFGTSAKLSVKWWEFDLGWLYIKLLQSVGLAKVKRLPPEMQRLPYKTYIDTDTIKAVLANRFQIMARYSKEVIVPVLQEEKQRAGDAGRSLLKRAKQLLIREQSLVDAPSKQRLAALLERHVSLQMVYQYRIKLQEIWSRTTATQKELVEALQEWCRQAEATGLEVLKEFAARLKTFAPVTVNA